MRGTAVLAMEGARVDRGSSQRSDEPRDDAVEYLLADWKVHAEVLNMCYRHSSQF